MKQFLEYKIGRVRLSQVDHVIECGEMAATLWNETETHSQYICIKSSLAHRDQTESHMGLSIDISLGCPASYAASASAKHVRIYARTPTRKLAGIAPSPSPTATHQQNLKGTILKHQYIIVNSLNSLQRQ